MRPRLAKVPSQTPHPLTRSQRSTAKGIGGKGGRKMEVVAFTCNFSTEAEARRLPLVRGQPGLKRVSLSRKKKKRSQRTDCRARFVETHEQPEKEPGDPENPLGRFAVVLFSCLSKSTKPPRPPPPSSDSVTWTQPQCVLHLPGCPGKPRAAAPPRGGPRGGGASAPSPRLQRV